MQPFYKNLFHVNNGLFESNSFSNYQEFTKNYYSCKYHLEIVYNTYYNTVIVIEVKNCIGMYDALTSENFNIHHYILTYKTV